MGCISSQAGGVTHYVVPTWQVQVLMSSRTAETRGAPSLLWNQGSHEGGAQAGFQVQLAPGPAGSQVQLAPRSRWLPGPGGSPSWPRHWTQASSVPGHTQGLLKSCHNEDRPGARWPGSWWPWGQHSQDNGEPGPFFGHQQRPERELLLQ